MTTNFNHKQYHFTKSDITLTAHSIQRAEERFGVTKKDEIKQMAVSAKNKGIRIWTLTKENYKSLGISWDTYRYLKNKYAKHYASDKAYYYKDKVFVFQGYKGNTLKSIIPCTSEEISTACVKMDAYYKFYELDKINQSRGGYRA